MNENEEKPIIRFTRPVIENNVEENPFIIKPKNTKTNKNICKVCSGILVKIGSKVIQTYRYPNKSYIEQKLLIIHLCGHHTEETVKHYNYTDVQSADRVPKKLFPYQIKTARFAEESNFRCLIGHAPGLGKTICAVVPLKFHDELLPVCIVTKASLKLQWSREILRWTNDFRFVPYVVEAGSDKLAPAGFNVTIISYQTLLRWKARLDNPFKLIILDECQTIKNQDTKATNAVRELCAGKDHVMGLSATPVKNHAGEYFSILNLIQPEMFPDNSWFIREWVDTWKSGIYTKYGGIMRTKLDEWKSKTSSFIIRSEKEDVLPELPKVFRTFEYAKLDERVQDAYDGITHALDKLEEGKDYIANVLALLAKLRHITGISKVPDTIERVRNFLENDDNEKITVFVHHIDVGGLIFAGVSEVCKEMGLEPPVRFESAMDSKERDEAIDKFRGNSRVLVASMLAAGEGLNLQFCSTCIIHERQWNPANEEQAEGRFPRPGNTSDSISAIYMVALGTIDEYFAELVERKREHVDRTLKGVEGIRYDESSLIKELVGKIKEKGTKFSLKSEKKKAGFEVDILP